MARCKACGSEIGGGNSEQCPVTKGNHRLDYVADERERAEREGREVVEHPSVNWARGPHS